MQNIRQLPLDDWFASIAPVTKPPHEAIVNDLLSRFGVRSALDIVKFMQSPEGKLAEACLNHAIQRDIGTQELSQFLQQLELQRQQHLAYFILSLTYDQEEARQYIRNIVEEEQQNRLLHPQKKPTPISPTHLPTPPFAVEEETIYHFEKARNALLEEMSFTLSETDALEYELQALEESIALLFTKKRLHRKFYEQFQASTEDTIINGAHIDVKIDAFIRAYQQEVITLQSTNTDRINDSFIEHWNLLDHYQLQVNTWQDFRNTLKPGQSIVQRNGVLYLIDQSMTFEALSLEARAKAAQAYLALKPQLEKTRLKMEDDDQIQHAELEERKKNLVANIHFEKDKINHFHTQLSSLDTAIASLSKALASARANETDRAESTLQLRPTPRPSFSAPRPTAASTTRPSLPSNIPIPAPRPAPSVQAQLILKLEMCKLRCEQSPHTNALSVQQLSMIAAVERSKLVEEIKARPRELIPGAQASPSLLSMLIALNKTPLNIQKRVNNTPEQQLEDEKLRPRTGPTPNPFKKWGEH